MAETGSPNANNHLFATYDDNTRQGSRRRGWRCPGEEVIATYVDGSVARDRRDKIQSHLSHCEFCRNLVADIVKAQRSEDPLLPPGLLQRAIAQTKPQSKRLAWNLMPVAATLMIACMVFATFMFRTSSRARIPSPLAPAAPQIAKATPAVNLGRPVTEKVRKLASVEKFPTVISPGFNSVVARDGIEFRWRPVPEARYYQLRLTGSDGDLVWESQSEATSLRLPPSVELRDGTYFVWILAELDGGQVRKSASVRFRVNASR